MSYHTFEGMNYDSHTDITEIAKMVRKFVKGMGVKASVRINRYSMGQSLSVRVKSFPFDEIYTEEFKAHRRENPMEIFHGEARMTDEAQELLTAIETYANRFNKIQSDSHTDLYNCNFHCFVDFDSDLLKEMR